MSLNITHTQLDDRSQQLWEQSGLAAIIGDDTAAILTTELGVSTIGGLLSYIPFRYENRGGLASAEPVSKGDRITVYGTIVKMEYPHGVPLVQGKPASYAISRMKFFRLIVKDSYRTYQVSFFNPRKLLHVFHEGQAVVLDGTVDFFRNQIQLAHPEWIILPEEISDQTHIPLASLLGSKKVLGALSYGDYTFSLEQFNRQIIPHYRATKALTSWEISAIIRRVLSWVQEQKFSDPLSEQIRAEFDIPELYEMWETLHLPENMSKIASAQRRVALEEALSIQLVLHERKMSDQTAALPSPQVLPQAQGLYAEFLGRLPFTLTSGQQQALEEIQADLSSAQPMNRLFQGEVGSGKTIVALLSMLTMIDAGYQCCFLAPTEVLAMQHYRTFRSLLGELAQLGEIFAGDNATGITLLTGSLSVGEKRSALLDAVSGKAGIVIGTHALLEERVQFFRLGYIIIDEQHRFGVQQREKLREKNSEQSPHVLVMTATPIPRTVALTRYGDLEVSILQQLPAGRVPIATNVVPLKIHPNWWDRAMSRMVEEIQAGHQVYFVCPQIIGESMGSISELLNQVEPLAAETFYTAFMQEFNQLDLGRAEPGIAAGLLHGKLRPDEKSQIMDDFHAGKIDVLISTTVIEVGVDVPNATMMVIMDADRFGVSQLHQLRGRVGRGKQPGLCLLVTRLPFETAGMARLDAVASTLDGFELSQIDLAQRREGDVLGDAQSGTFSSFRALSLLEDEDIISYAYDLVKRLAADEARQDEFMRINRAYSQYFGMDKLDYLDKA